MKKRMAAFFLAIVSIFCFMFAGCEKPKTDKEMVTARIESFEKSYNDGDYEGFLANMATKERKELEAAFNILGSLMGGLAGFDIDLADWFSLGINMQEGDWLNIEIKEIKFTSSTTAIAKTDWQFTQGFGNVYETSEMYFYMIKENGDWYVQDMNEYGPSNWEDISSEPKESVSSENGEETSSDSGENGGTESENTIPLSYCDSFVDGYAWVGYEDADDSRYYCFIDIKGNVIYKESYNTVITKYNIGNGCAYVYSNGGTHKLINAEGKVTTFTDGFDEVVLYGGGYIFVYKYVSGIMAVEHLYGILSGDGEWIMPMENFGDEGYCDNIKYVGNDLFTFYDEYYSDNTGAYVYEYVFFSYKEMDVVAYLSSQSYRLRNEEIEFVNGIAYIENDYHVEYEYSFYNHEEDCWTYARISDNFIIYADGAWHDVAANDCSWYSDGKAIYTNGEYLEIEDVQTNDTVQFTKYPASMIKDAQWNGDYGLLKLYGVDENYYLCLIDESGNELFDPIQLDDSYCDYCLMSGGNFYYTNDRDTLYHVDKNGNKTNTGFYFGIFDKINDLTLTSTSNNYWSYKNYYYLNAKGEKLFEGITE